jgi:hypothetical protein
VIVSVVVAEAPDTFTEDAEKAKLAAMDELELIEKLTGPLKPFAGATVNAIPEAVAPEVTAVDVVQGVRAKSALLEETKSPIRLPFELV